MNFFALNLTPDKAERAEADVLGALVAAKDNSMQLINGTVVNGFDAVLLDAIFGTPQPDMCPFIGINSWVAKGTDAQGGKEVYRPYVMSMYFIYYIGNLATAHPPIPFTVQRARHLSACMQAIEMQSGGNPTATIPASHGWKWATELQVNYDYFSPFRYINESYKLPSDYNCVRIDRPLRVYFSV